MHEIPTQPEPMPEGWSWSSDECAGRRSAATPLPDAKPDWWRDEFDGRWARPAPPAGPTRPRSVYLPDRSLRPARPPERAPAGAAAVPTHLCLVVGPPQSGKTALIAAMDRVAASTTGPDASGRMQTVRGDGIEAFIQRATAMFRARIETPAPSEWLSDAALRIEAASAPGDARSAGRDAQAPPQCAEVLAREVHAVAVFRPRWTSPSPASMLDLSRLDSPRRSRAGVSLWLCVDSVQPRADLWHEWLPGLLARWTSAAGAGGRLPFGRVVLLLTKIDLFCARALRALRARHPGEAPWSDMQPHDLARRLDPVQQGRVLLGDAILSSLHAHLRSSASLAAGLVSATGFDEQGRAVVVGEQAGLSDWRYSEWRPFGVREALSFAAFGWLGHPLTPLLSGDLALDLQVLTPGTMEAP